MVASYCEVMDFLKRLSAMNTSLAHFLLLLLLSLSFRGTHSQQCLIPFTEEPATSSGSPHQCNVVGATIEMKCAAQRDSVTFSWFYTTSRDLAGMSSEVPVLSDGNGGYSITERLVNSGKETTLDIETFRMDQSGYYWCRLLDVQIGETANRHQSQVVHIQANFTTAELEPCSNTLVLSRSGGQVGNCAFQAVQNTPITIVTAGIFAGAVTTPMPTTEPLTTTEEPTTMVTTEQTTMRPTRLVTTTLGATDPPGEGTVFTRTAIIWFSVGAVVFTLLAIAFVLCVIGLIKC